MFVDFITNLQKLLEKRKLPGSLAHKEMLPEGRDYFNYSTEGRDSAVMILLFPQKDSFNFVLVKRIIDHSPHSGQISFPGGQKEYDDSDLIDTAIRETYEEIGVKLARNNILGALTPLYISVSFYNVFPYIGIMDFVPEFKPNIKEIEQIIIVDFEKLIKSKILNNSFKSFKKMVKAPAFVFENYYVWGATAMILNEFKFLIKEVLNIDKE